MQADMHYRHTLLGKTLAAWKVGGNVLFFEGLVCVLLSVSVRTEELPCCFTLGTYTPSMQGRMEAVVNRVV